MKIDGLLTRSAIQVVIACVWLYSAPALAAGGYVHDAAGDVSVIVGKNAAHAAAKNDAIAPGTEVHTGTEGYAVLKFEDGQVATMQANTTIYVRAYRYDTKLINKNSIIFSRLSGGMRFITGLIGQRDHKAFRLSTPNATIGVRGTEFVVATNKGALYSQVISGSISMTNTAGVVVFKAGQTILVKTAHSLPTAIPAAALPPGIFSQLDAIPTPPTTPTLIPEAGAAANVSATIGTVLGATLSVATAGASASAPLAGAPGGVPSGAVPLGTAPSSSGELSSLADKIPATSAMAASTPKATTISHKDERAVYTGADLLCDFCTRSTPAVAAHVDTNTAAGDPVTGEASLFGLHNLTPTGANTGEICAFCHTPQGDENRVSAPRWNRTLTTLGNYRAFSSLGSAAQQATGSVSMSCLSCHDGSQAPNIAINTPNLRLDVGSTEVNIGNSLRNHHPVGVQYAGGGQNENAPDIPINPIAVVERLEEFNRFATGNKFTLYPSRNKFFNSRDADALSDVRTFSTEGQFNSTKGGFNKSTYSGTGSGTVWWVKSPASKKGRQKSDLYLFTRTDTIDSLPDESIINRPYVECATCHDPHSTNSTFLRPPGGNARSQICLTCHNK